MHQCDLYRRELHARVQKWGRQHPGGRLHWGGLKDFADGSLGSQTALMHQPYANDPSSRGVRLTAKETLQELVTAADMAGLQVIGCWVASLYVASPLWLFTSSTKQHAAEEHCACSSPKSAVSL